MAYTDGVILVYDPDSPGQDQQLTLWYDFFVKRNGLRDEQCLIFAHRGNSNEKFKPRKIFFFQEAKLTQYFGLHCKYTRFIVFLTQLPSSLVCLRRSRDRTALPILSPCSRILSGRSTPFNNENKMTMACTTLAVLQGGSQQLQRNDGK